MQPAAAVRHFQARLRAIGTPERAAAAKAYMKSELHFDGVRVPALRAEARAFLKAQPEIDRDALVAIAGALFATDHFELRSAAIELLALRRALLVPGDATWLVEMARRGACWAHVDDLVTSVLDPLLDGDASLARRVRAWAKDRSFWVRRTALLAQLGELRRGRGDFALFAEIAEPMLDEKEFFIRKAIGWVLREVSKKRPALVGGFVCAHAGRLSGVTWREATKYLPPTMKRRAERARLTRRPQASLAEAPP
jgi:3-methyladenine DNA glycosylase AlkD